MSWLKGGAAVLTAVVVAIGGLALIAFFMYEGIVAGDVGVPILAGGIVGAYGFLWQKANQDANATAYREGLMTPTPGPQEPIQVDEPVSVVVEDGPAKK